MGPIFHELARQKECRIIEGHLLADHVHVCIGGPPRTLLIHAVASGVGLAALQLAKSSECIVFGTSRSEEKLARAHGLGLDASIHAGKEDFHQLILNRTDGEGVDAIISLISWPVPTGRKTC